MAVFTRLFWALSLYLILASSYGEVEAVSDGSQGNAKPGNCLDVRASQPKSGVANIYLPDQVYCDQDTDQGGWTVFQRRQDGSVDFYRNWTEYQCGFGDPKGEFWLGLDALHKLTSTQTYELRVDLMKFDGTKGYATYSNFTIAGSDDNYRLHYDRKTGGNIGDSLAEAQNQQFSTYDADHDKLNNVNCASDWHGAWWYHGCHYTNLNGRYKANGADGADGVVWFWFNYWKPLKFAEMKIRPQ